MPIFIFRSICSIGFTHQLDAMRIPSTKRICFVSSSPHSDAAEKYSDETTKKQAKFIPRDVAAEMAPRNCRSVSKSCRDLFVKRSVEHLKEKSGSKETSIGRIVALFDSDMLSQVSGYFQSIQTKSRKI